MKRAAIVGWPVEHSLSPLIHGIWLEKHGIEGRYDRIPIAPGKLEEHMPALRQGGLVGFNVTMPHKQAIMNLLDEVDDQASRIGAVNTVTVRDGRLIGTNTDAWGFLQHLVTSAGETWNRDAPALLVGAGGAARAAAVALLDAGVPEIWLTNRTGSKADGIASDLGRKIRIVPWEGRNETVKDVSLIVNTTSLGMAGNPPLRLELGAASDTCIVYDIVYKPLLTPLLASARERGLQTVDGLGMLLHQAVPGFALWFREDAVVDEDLVTRVRKIAGC